MNLCDDHSWAGEGDCPKCERDFRDFPAGPANAAPAAEAVAVSHADAEAVARRYCGGADTRWSFSDAGLRLMLQRVAAWGQPASTDAREQEASFAHKVKVWSAEIERLIGIADKHAPGQGALDTALSMLDYMKRQAALASRSEAPEARPNAAHQAEQWAMCHAHGETLQQIGSLLDLPAGTDLHLAILPAIQKLLALRDTVNTPHTDDFFRSVDLEAAHQIERWGDKHDSGKTPTDWLFLLGYLAGKAATSFIKGDPDKGKHHIISSGAVLLNWWRHVTGVHTAFRPGHGDE